MSFSEVNEVKFELNDAFTWGVKKDKFGGYSIPVVVDDETKTKIESLCKEHSTKNPLYTNTLYLKSKNLSEKQKKELFNKGRLPVMVHFKATGTYTKDDTSYLVFKVIKLCKLDKPESDERKPSVAECPED